MNSSRLTTESRFLTSVSFRDVRRFQILEAMDRLADVIPFEKLTVKRICGEANISRQTFYNYFKDKFEVGQWFWRISAEQYLRETGRTVDWYEGNLGMLEQMALFSRFVMYSFHESDNYNSPTNYGYRQRILYLRETLEHYLGQQIDKELEFQIKFFVDAESRVVTTWVESGMQEDPEWLSHNIERCVPPRLRTLVDEALAHNCASQTPTRKCIDERSQQETPCEPPEPSITESQVDAQALAKG